MKSQAITRYFLLILIIAAIQGCALLYKIPPQPPLSRALAIRPQVLLLDEPLSGLDAKIRVSLRAEIRAIQRQLGITAIYVTHDQQEAMTMSNRLAVMRHGKIEQLGPPEDVYENPATEFVAGFLGASNLLEGDVKETSDGTSTVQLDAGGALRMPSARIPSDASGHIKVGVRPEKISIQRGQVEAPSDHNAITGTVIMSTYIGVNHQYKVETPGTTMTVYVQNLKAEDDPRQGEHVTLTWLLEHTFAVTPQEGLSMEEEQE